MLAFELNIMSSKWLIFATLVLTTIPNNAANNEIIDSQQDQCRSQSSCATCITKSSCTWCVTKSKCTKNFCGNDNVIYPKDSSTIMAGPKFCPRVVEPAEIFSIESGKKTAITVKLTQIHLYMAFTPWKCKITFNGLQMTVVAMLVVDNLHCEPVVLTNKSNEPYMNGTVSVLWDYSKSFDGTHPFRVCRCDLDSSCKACK